MPDRRRGAQVKPKAISVETRQKTLLDLFPRKTVSLEAPSVDKAPAESPLSHQPEIPTTTTSATHANAGVIGITTDRIVLPNSRSKPLHPLFAKQSHRPKAPTIQNSIPEDEIIEVPDNALEPYSSQPGGSQEDPIILDSSPTRPALPPLPQSGPPQLVIGPPFVLPVSSRAEPSKGGDAADVPYPDDISQHVRGPQRIYPAPEISYFRRPQRPTTTSTYSLPVVHLNEDTDDGASSTDTMHFLPYTATGKEKYLEQIPSEHSRFHPAILRFVSSDAAHPTSLSTVHNVWADKWRPTRAAEVLGNESNAVYLRDWLRALELHFHPNPTSTPKQDHGTNGTTRAGEDARRKKRPRVVRAVHKRRGRKKRRIDSDNEDDWIVNSDEPIEEAFGDETDDDIGQAPLLQLDPNDSCTDPNASAPPSHFSQHFSNHLTNTIVLAGPSGVGKTAAVYACADELGWEVFEVYPGIGKRNGASIENMIGDVGKNHLVRKTQHRGGEPPRVPEGRDAFATLLGKGQDPAGKRPPVCHSPTDDFGFVSRPDNQPGQGIGVTSTVRQSLILLEEVDILFKEDSNFWPTVTNFIKDSKRPVICTCNDVSLIPTLDLPLQTILTFQASSAPVAASYLQGLCSAEGYLVNRESLLGLYDSTCKSTDLPASANGTLVDLPVSDLRRTINCLQFRCLTTDIIPPSGCTVRLQIETENSMEDLLDWDWSKTTHTHASDSSVDARFSFRDGSVIDHADLISFIDSQLPSGLDTSAAFDGFEPSFNDEVDRTTLFHTIPAAGCGYKFQHNDIASTAMRLSRGLLERQQPTIDVNSGFRTRELFRARVEHQTRVAEGLKNLVPLSVWVMHNHVVHMDYGPWIRHIVAEEDLQEALHIKKELRGRKTRNSGGGYVRTIPVSAEDREALAATRLVGFSL